MTNNNTPPNDDKSAANPDEIGPGPARAAGDVIVVSEILDELDQAIGDHMTWLAGLNALLLCNEKPEPRELAFDPHHLCRFGSWYIRHQHSGLVNQPVLRNLAAIHKTMHDQARKLVTDAHLGQTASRGTYDAFMDHFNGFIRQARRLEKAFAKASSDLDPLTGLHNRQAMTRELEIERERHQRSGMPLAIAVGDLDHFKSVNDTYGHSTGDRVLMTAAEVFLASVRPYDAVYRFGGEEFVFCLPDTDLETAKGVMDRLRVSLSERVIPVIGGGDMSVTGSFGIAALDGDMTIKDAIERADLALYDAKEAGRNQVHCWGDFGKKQAAD